MPRRTQNATASKRRDNEASSADAVQMLQQDHRTGPNTGRNEDNPLRER